MFNMWEGHRVEPERRSLTFDGSVDAENEAWVAWCSALLMTATAPA